MYSDAFDDDKSCQFEGKSYDHGSETCEIQGKSCMVCINGRWASKQKEKGSR